MNTLALFDGIGCGLEAIKRLSLPFENYFASEIDATAMWIASKNHKEIKHIGDVKGVKSSDLPKIDLLIGGSPCQGFSTDGSGLAFRDPRSKLFYEFARLLSEAKPKYFLLENVQMLKEHREHISGILGVRPININSSLVSAQLRERLYWTNIPDIKQPEDKGIKLNDILISGYSEREKSYCIDANYHKGSNPNIYFNKNKRQMVFDKTAEGVVYLRKLKPIECERLQTLPDNYTEGVYNGRRYECLGNCWTVDVICHILKNMRF